MIQVTLGQLIQQLELGNPTNEVRYDFPDALPTTFSSYRGYYDHLALGHGPYMWTEGWTPPTVSSLLVQARAALGSSFEGWKGGYYRMTADTPVWVDKAGRSSGVAIVGVSHGSIYSYLITELRDD